MSNSASNGGPCMWITGRLYPWWNTGRTEEIFELRWGTHRRAPGPQSFLDELVHGVADVGVAAARIARHGPQLLAQVFFIGWFQTKDKFNIFNDKMQCSPSHQQTHLLRPLCTASLTLIATKHRDQREVEGTAAHIQTWKVQHCSAI